MNVIILYTIIVILLVSSIYIINRINRLSRIKSELEYKNLILQLNPHFIFNSLTAVQNYILVNETSRANSYLSNLSKLIRLALENSRSLLITLDKEVNYIKLFLEMQSMRFEGKFVHSVYVDKEINAELVRIPPMLLQPFIENAAEHGYIRFSSGGELNISYRKIQNSLVIEMEDICVDFAIDQKIVETTTDQHLEKTKIKVLERMHKLKQATGIKPLISVSNLNRTVNSKKGIVVKIILPIN